MRNTNTIKMAMTFGLLIVLSVTVSAQFNDLCDSTPDIVPNCTMLTPQLNCTATNFTYDIINGSGVVTTNEGNLTLFANDIYYFNFTEGKGEFIVQLCDGSTREVFVGGDEDNMPLAAILLIPLLFAAIILGAAALMDKNEHGVIRHFLTVFALLNIIPTLAYAFIVNIEQFGFASLESGLAWYLRVVGIALMLVIGYFFIYLLYKYWSGIRRQKLEKLRY